MKRNVVFALVPVLGLASLLGYILAAVSGHGCISVPSAAFRPESHTYQVEYTYAVSLPLAWRNFQVEWRR